MPYHNHLPVYQSTYSFLLNLYRCTKKFPKDLKYSLGTKCFDAGINLMEIIIDANQAISKQEFISRALSKAELICSYLRLSEDMDAITDGEFEVLSVKLTDIIVQLKAWHKWSVASAKKSC